MGRKPISKEEANRRLFEKHNGNIIMKNYIALYEEADFNNLLCGHSWRVVAYSTIESGHGCPICAKNSLKILLTTPEDEVVDKINEIHCGEIVMKNYVSVGKKADFICLVCGNNWKTTVHSVIVQKTGCRTCSIRRKSGSNSRLWKGGISKLRDFIRESTYFETWQRESMEKYNYECVFTESKDFQIHHLYLLNKIIRDSLVELGLEKYDFIGDYSEEDMQPIIDKIMEIHYRYPLGVCLRKDIHKLFHKLYGKNDCTPEDFYEFAERIKSGEIEIQ